MVKYEPNNRGGHIGGQREPYNSPIDVEPSSSGAFILLTQGENGIFISEGQLPWVMDAIARAAEVFGSKRRSTVLTHCFEGSGRRCAGPTCGKGVRAKCHR